MKKVYLAADVGAGSGRVLAGIFEDGKLSLEEICRFDNQPVELNGSLHWEITHVYSEIKKGIAEAICRYGDQVKSIGIDTWGVDYALLDSDSRMLGIPYCYRDGRTDGMIERADAIMSQSERYAHAGIQLLHFNTLYQLLAEQSLPSSQLKAASAIVFIPDLINFWLSGKIANEVTIASTGELLDAKTGHWSNELFEKYSLPKDLFRDLVEPGEVLGPLKQSIAEELGIETAMNVVATPSHDTAAAVAACPLSAPDAIYISSGTWSLMGMESDTCCTDSAANEMGLTNERGVEGTTRLLKNISGFWIFQQAKRDWDRQGHTYDYDQLRDMAAASEPFKAFLDPNDSCFERPGNMVGRIEEYYARTGQQVDMEPAVVCRSIFEGLALSYRKVIDGIRHVTGKTPKVIHIIGGGSQNPFLNQLTADATKCKVVAGPLEGSSLGNILAQLKADGEIEKIRAGRDIISRSFEVKSYEPKDDLDWESAYARFLEITA